MNWAVYGSAKVTSECHLTIMEGSVGLDIGEDYEEMDVEREGKRERERERSMVFF